MSLSESQTKKVIESQLSRAAQVIEDVVDQEIARLDSMDEDDLEKIRQRRLAELKEKASKKEEWLANGHGIYSELASERDFFSICKQSTSVCAHFYRSTTVRCAIFDKHLSLLAPRHLECRFIKVDVEKSPFLVSRLGVRVLPTLILIKEEKVVGRVIGFDDLGGHDDFSTEMLDWRLGVAGIVDYNGDLSQPPDFAKNKKKEVPFRRSTKTIRDGGNESDDDDDE
ncbi:Thioredoxin domain-containing protein 9 [Taenia crassiceps]|uniref:Thioredoxin domain-containing protein 9 n=1 Tax=Taenia crassiceps TaxID=6207 RepID=A0ABR4Q5Z1_9CEST